MNEITRPRWIYGAIILAAVGLLFCGIVIGSQVGQNKASIEDLCASNNDSRFVLQNVLLLSQAQGTRRSFPARIKSGGKVQRVVITFPDLNRGTDQFYRRAIRLAHPIDCTQ